MPRYACRHPRQPEFTYLGLMTLSELTQLASSGPPPERDWATGELAKRSEFCPVCPSKITRESSLRAAWTVLVVALFVAALVAIWRCL